MRGSIYPDPSLHYWRWSKISLCVHTKLPQSLNMETHGVSYQFRLIDADVIVCLMMYIPSKGCKAGSRIYGIIYPLLRIYGTVYDS